MAESSGDFWNGALEKWARERPLNPVFCENGEPAVTYSDLLEFSRAWRGALKGKPAFFCVNLARGAEEGAVITACLESGMPGFCFERKSPASFFTRAVNQFGPTHLVVRESDWKKKATEFPLSVAEIFRYRWPGAGEDTVVVQLSSEAQCPAPVAWVLLTSGSTGRRKGVGFSAEALRSRLESECQDFCIRGDDHLLNILSLAHDLGLNQLLTTVESGATLDFRTTISGADLWNLLAQNFHSGVTATPLAWRNVLAVIDEHGSGPSPAIFSRLRFLTVSGGSLSTQQLLQLRAIFPSTKLIYTYGQTETFRTFLSIFPDDGTPNDSFHRVVSGVRVKLAGDTEGELVHLGPSSLCARKENERWDLHSGEVHTGDYFRRTTSGFRFLGRRDHMIKRHEHRLYLSEVENFLRECGLIQEAALFGGNHEPLAAFLVPNAAGRLLGESALRLELGKRLPFHMIPEKLFFRDSLPLTDAMKVNREILRGELRALIS